MDNLLAKWRQIRLSSGFSQTLTYSVGLVFLKGISFIMLPFVTYFLSVDEFGRLEVLVILESFGTILFNAGLQDSLYRFAGASSDQQQQNAYCANALSTAIGVSLVLGAIGLSTLSLSQAWLPGDLSKLQIAAIVVNLMFGCIQSIQLGWLRLQQYSLMFTLFACGRGMLQAISTLLLLHLGYGVTGVVIAGAFTAMVTTLILLFIQAKDTGLGFNIRIMRQLIHYGAPLIISGLSTFSFYGLERWWLADYISLKALAIYALAFKFASVIDFIMQPFLWWWEPRRFTLTKDKQAIATNARISTIGIVLYFGAALLVSLAGFVAIYLLTPVAYHPARQYILILATLIAAKEAAEMTGFGCYLKKTGATLMSLNVICAVIAIGLYALLIPTTGTQGVILSLLCVYAVRWALLWTVSQRQLYLPYPLQHIAMACLIPLVGATLTLRIPSQTTAFGLLLMTSTFFVVYSAYFKLIPSLKTFIRMNA